MKGQHCSAVEEQKRVAMRTVLILTQSHDPHLPPVAEAIRARGAEVLCFHLADFPEVVAMSAVLESLALQLTLWVSHLHSTRRAELKPLQLAAAQQLGLRTPRTLLTNDSGAARAFYETCQGQVVLKAVSRGAIEEEERRFIAPRLIIARTPRACACSCGGGPAIEISVPPRRSVASELLKVSPPTPSSTRSISWTTR